MFKNYKMLKNYNFIENTCKDNLIKKVQQHPADEVDCFICFMPSEKNNQIKMLSEFSHIIQKCKCNSKIHLQCLNNWINKRQSCPICRTKCLRLPDTNLQETNLQKYYIICIINISLFIILIFNLCLIIFIFPHILFQIYLSIKL